MDVFLTDALFVHSRCRQWKYKWHRCQKLRHCIFIVCIGYEQKEHITTPLFFCPMCPCTSNWPDHREELSKLFC